MGLDALLPGSLTPDVRKTLRTIGFASVVLIIALLVAIPGAALPGIAKSHVAGDEIVIEFESGDRYFWLPAATKDVVHASDVVGELDGKQSLTKRSSYNSLERVAFDEGHGGTDFVMEPNFLYEVAVVDEGATVRFDAKPGTSGQSFMQDIAQNSNSFLKRLGSYLVSLPGIVWDDVRQVQDDIHDVFKPSNDDGEAGTGSAAAKSFKQSWPVLIGVAAIAIIGPFIGIDSLIIGALCAIVLAMGGSWPFYVMAGVAIAAGFLLDNNSSGGQPNVVQRILGNSIEGAELFAYENKRTVTAIMVVIVTLLTAGILAWLGHANIAAVAIVLGGLFATALLATGGKNSKGQYTAHRLKVAPAIAMFMLAGAGAAGLMWLGYASFGWGLLAVALVGFGYWIHSFRRVGQAKAEGKLYNPGASRKDFRRRLGSNYDDSVRRTSGGIKVVGFLAAATVWLAVAALADRDYIVASAYALIGLATLAVVTFIVWPRRNREAGLEEEDEEDEQTSVAAETTV